MTTKITMIFDPTDPEAFETAYADGSVELARALPGLLQIETSKVWPQEDGTPTPKYPAARGLATGGATFLFSDLEIALTWTVRSFPGPGHQGPAQQWQVQAHQGPPRGVRSWLPKVLVPGPDGR